jgi:LytS/YehU family sensor histidine kinase
MKEYLDSTYLFLKIANLKFHLKSIILLSGISYLILTQTDFPSQPNYLSLIAFLVIYYSISFLVTKKISIKTISWQIFIVLIWISATTILLYVLITANYLTIPEFPDNSVFSKYKLGFIFLLSAVIFTYTSITYLIKTNTELRDLLKKNKLENELLKLNFLRAQMNPHFVFNCLVNLSDTIRSGETENAIRYNNSLSKLFRFQLEYADKKMISLTEELEWLKQYIEIEMHRYPGLFEYTIESENTDTQELFIPPMMLQPFVENCIQHVFIPSKETLKGKLFIRVIQTDAESYYIEIEDNGKNHKLNLENKLKWNETSIAINNVTERIKLLRSTSHFSISLYTQKNATGFCVRLEVALKE